MNYLDLSIEEMHKAIVDGNVTPLELVLESIKRAKEDKNNAFEYICEKEAIEFAKTLTNVEPENLLYGIPYCLKDNFSTKNIPTTGSSNILNGYIPVFDATVKIKLHELKAVLIGKTTLDELAMGGTGTTGHLGITQNPYSVNKDRLCGGSSCGSAVAVSTAIVPFALGSDTGDSVRKPASYVGLVGMKPTWGRISRYGLFPFAPSLDHVAYFTRSIRDSAIVLNALAGRDLLDSTSSDKIVPNYLSSINDFTPKSLRIAVISEIENNIEDKIIRKTFSKSCDDLTKMGYSVDHVHIDENLLKAILPTYFIISCAEAGSNNANLDGIKFGARKDGETYEDVVKNTRTAGFSELIKRRFITGSFVLMSENQDELFIKAQKVRRLIVDTINNILKTYDAIYVPAAPTIAPKFSDSSNKLSEEYLIADNHLAIGNFAGLPSITIPAGFENNMPYGFSLTCGIFDEEKLFSIAKHIEDITGLAGVSARTYKGGK